jgi:hypothetical protein
VRHVRSKWWPQSVAPSHVALLPSRPVGLSFIRSHGLLLSVWISDIHALLSVTNWGSFMLLRRPSIQRIFGIQPLDHSCCSISTSDSRYSCYSSQAVLRKHSPRTIAVRRTSSLIHSLSLLSSALSGHLLIAIAIRLVQPSLYLWSLILLSYRPCQSITVATRVGSQPTPARIWQLCLSRSRIIRLDR